VHTKIYADHQLIKTGPYKILRHPYYIAVLLELTGLSLIYNSIAGIILTYCVQLPFLLYRIPKEENTLINKFGEKY
jgi:protein-S-isoprenylcysteine O-methyltransferase Ste14